jgi:BirA family transcriptional regulator, biotin operon repressor / biotin---[acetyl-CoA-carboxylase] ligase
MSSGKLQYLKQCTSTQDHLKNAIESINPPFAFYTDHQTNGYGQYDSIWECPNGSGLAFSMALKVEPPFKEHLVNLNKAVTAAITECIASIAGPIEIKWPNDLIFRDKKLGGIIMNLVNDNSILLIGFGINLKKIKNTPVAISLEELQMEADVHVIAQSLYHTLTQIQSLSVDKLKHIYDRSLWSLNEQVSLNWAESNGNQSESAIFRGVDEHGRAVIEQDGELKTYQHGQVRLKYTR